MGLRQLYFLIGSLLERLVYLSLGLAVILGFIALKLIGHAMHHYGLDQAWFGFSSEVSIGVSLGVIAVTLALTTVASLIKSRKDDATADV
ncbi:TerC family protein, partial [Streptomyces scabiei]|jgi:tellurite resistance protein TerC